MRACRALSQEVGIPQHLSDLDITASDMEALVAGALAVTRLLRQNPRPMGEAEVRALFEQAM